MKFKALFTTTLLLFGLTSACSFNNFEDDVEGECQDIEVTFSGTIQPIFTKYCSNSSNGDCHFQGATTTKPDYTSYDGIKSKIDDGRIEARMFDKSPSVMPPAFTQGPSAVDECDKKFIRKWIEAGAPNN